MKDDNTIPPMNPLDQALGLPALVREVTEVLVPEDPAEDFAVARENVHGLIVTTKDAVRDMSELAWTSQSSRAYEVLGQLIEKSLAANRELFEIAKRKRDLEGSQSGEGPKTINNTLLLTSAEMLELVKKKLST